MKNLKIISLNVGQSYHLLRTRKDKMRGNVITEMMKRRNPDVITFQELSNTLFQKMKKNFPEYNVYHEKTKSFSLLENPIMVKKGLPVTFNKSYLFNGSCCHMITLNLQNNDLCIFNATISALSKKNRYIELSNLYQLIENSFDDKLKIVIGNFHMEMKSPLFEFMKINHLTNATMHLGSSRVDKTENAISHIFIPEELNSFESHKITASQNKVVASPNFALETTIKLDKVKSYRKGE